jgi:hypothetical protein
VSPALAVAVRLVLEIYLHRADPRVNAGERGDDLAVVEG